MISVDDINPIPTDSQHLKLSYEITDTSVDDDFCELSSVDSEIFCSIVKSNAENVCELSSVDSKSFCSKVQSNVENVFDNAYQKKRAFSKVTLSPDRKRLKPIDGKVEYLLLDGEFVSIGELSCNEVIQLLNRLVFYMCTTVLMF
jgi:hypothetical protein